MKEWDKYIETHEDMIVLQRVFGSLKELGVVSNFWFDYWEEDILDEAGEYVYYTEVMVDMEIWVGGQFGEYWAHSRHRKY
jgi:hypothetical protein